MRHLTQQSIQHVCRRILGLLVTLTVIAYMGGILLKSPALAEENPADTNASDPPSSFSEEPSELSLFEDIPMVVTVSKKPERVTEAPSIVSIITAEDIERMGARTIMDVLRTIPGFEIHTDAWNVSQITVRGLRSETSSGVKILIDGHALNDPFTGGATEFYEDLPLSNVQRIEVIRGPASSLYGANAFVSVINILTKDALDINGINVSVRADTFHTVNPSFQWGKIINNLEMTLFVDYLTTQGGKLSVSADSMSVYDQSVAGIYPPVSLAPGDFREEQERIDVAYKLAYHGFTLYGRFLRKEWGPFLTDYFILNDDSAETVTHFYTALDFQRFLTERLEIQGKAYVDYFFLEEREHLATGLSLPSPLRENETYTYPNGIMVEAFDKSWRVGGEQLLNYRLFARNDLTLGIAYEYLVVADFDVRTNAQNIERDLPPDELYNLDVLLPDVQTSLSRSVFSLFAQDTWSVRQNIDLTLGLRGDFFSDFGGVLTPKVGITYRPDPRVNVKAMFGNAFRVPAFYETFIERPSQGSAARDDLVVENLGMLEIGVGYKPFEWLLGEMNVFSTAIRRLAKTTDPGNALESDDNITVSTADGELVYESIGGIDVQGVELELRGEREQDIEFGIIPRVINSSFRINYSYQEGRDAETQEILPSIARHKGNIDLGLRFSSISAKTGKSNLLGLFRSLSDEFSLHTHIFLSGKRERSAQDVRDDLPPYALMDLTFMAHDVFRKGLDVSLSVKNLLDTDYRDPSPEFIPEEPLLTIPDDYPNPGRSIFVEFRYAF
nr:putative outer membrane protein [uncultured bacterium]